MANGISVSAVMNFLVEHSPPNLPPKALAEVFDRLIWCLDDNGEELLMVRDTWLEDNDRRRVAIALAMNETFPFDGGRDMQAKLEGIARRWPEFAVQCHDILARAKLLLGPQA